jgi:hypothetical protein
MPLLLLGNGSVKIPLSLLSNNSAKTLPRQRLGKNSTDASNTYATIEELLDTSFSMRSMSLSKKVGDYFFPELLLLIKEEDVT